MKYASLFFWLLVYAGTMPAHANDVAVNDSVEADLFERIVEMDKAFFDAFTGCDLEKMGEMYAHDLEFYHDLGGLDDYQKTLEKTKALCDRNLGLTRRLDSVEVYPVEGHGAIQEGRHTFCHVENGRDDCGTFKFLHVWANTPDGWKLARVISYGH